MEKIIQISTTADNRDTVEQIGFNLVRNQLVACAQITGPIKSTYTWKGVLENTDEWLLIMKSRASLFPAIEQAVRKQHPYEVPEIIATEISMISPDYYQWLLEQTVEAAQRE